MNASAHRSAMKVGLKAGGAIAAAVLVLSGCSGGGAAASEGAATTVESLEAGDTLTVGVCLRTPPWGQLDAAGEPEGWDVDLVNFIGEDLGVDVEIVEVTTASRIPSLQSGKVDLISCNFTVNEERKKQIDFSDPVIYMGNSILTRADSDIETVEDLTGRTVAVTKGGTSIEIMQEANPDAVLQPYESPADSLLAVVQGQAEAKIDKDTSVALEASKNPDLKVAAAGEVGPKVEYGLGLKKGQPELLETINGSVARFHEQGVGVESYEKWFGEEPTYHFEGL
jgi:polar amino acid transport system substrate-binding protein